MTTPENSGDDTGRRHDLRPADDPGGDGRPLAEDLALPVIVEPNASTSELGEDWNWKNTSASQPNAAVFPHQPQRCNPVVRRRADVRRQPTRGAVCRLPRDSHCHHRQPGQILGRGITADVAPERVAGSGGRRHRGRGEIQVGRRPFGADSAAAAAHRRRHRAGAAG